jgi:ADP-ribose pyrophosphatase YjhB (NUDIX family)
MEKIKKTRFGLGVFVCVFNKDFSKLLMLRRNEEKRKKNPNGEWGNVGGRIELGESSDIACMREVSEETGIILKREDIIQVMIIEAPDWDIYGDSHVLHVVYAASIPENTKVSLNKESDNFKWFPLNELPEKMLDKKEDIIDISKKAKKLFEE